MVKNLKLLYQAKLFNIIYHHLKIMSPTSEFSLLKSIGCSEHQGMFSTSEVIQHIGDISQVHREMVSMLEGSMIDVG